MSGGIPGWAIDELTTRLVTKWLDPDTPPKTMRGWRSTLVKAIVEDWRDPKRKPKPPESKPSAEEAARIDAERRAYDERQMAEKQARVERDRRLKEVIEKARVIGAIVVTEDVLRTFIEY